MTHTNNIIRLGELVGPPTREASNPVRVHGDAGPGRGPDGAGAGATAGSEPCNVIAFTRLRRDIFGEDVAAKFALGGAERLAPELGLSGLRARTAAFLLCSAIVHAGLLAALDREPTPMASIGLEAISVEIVLGAPADAEPPTPPTETQTTAPIPTPADPQQPATATQE